MNWLPIETAPTNGAKFLALQRNNPEPFIAKYAEDYDQYEDANGERLVFALTHWMPLPPPPNIGEKK